MRKLIYITAHYISKVNNYTKDQEQQVEYALKVFVFEALKTIGTFAIFCVLGKPIYALVAIITMITTKPFIGGYHEDNQVKCFISTVLIIGSVIYLSYNADINLIGKVILSIVSLYCIWNQAPIVNSAMPITREDLLIKNRNIGIILSSVFIIIGLIFYRLEVVSNTITWMMLFQALLMFNKRKSNQ